MELDFADPKPSVYALLVITIMAIIGINLAKWFVAKFPVPGLTEVVMNA